ncbi:hypothetical protein [Cylindrospermopsis curvispora]|uniref:hypothetical protein n=1 Tax=Cylindrospermopsis curvispora TaxID=747548 RepID=UPI001F24DA12|nr:hypothetical protein [Cylindrospermopsis curvispora]
MDTPKTEIAAKNLERWFEGIQILIRSDQTVSSTEIACGVDKPLKNHLETTMKQEVGSKVQNCKGLSGFG